MNLLVHLVSLFISLICFFSSQIVNAQSLKVIQTPADKTAESSDDTKIPDKPSIPDTKIDLLFFPDLNGQFAPPGCGKKDTSGISFLSLKLLARRLRVKAFDEGRDPPIILSGGNMIFPDAFGSFIFSTEKRANWAAHIISDMRLDAISVGLNDLSAPPGHFRLYLEKGSAKDQAFVLTNIECTNRLDNWCSKFVRPFRIIERNGVKFAVLSLMSPDHHKHLSKELRKRIKIEDPVKTWKKWASWLIRKQKIDSLILLSHLDRSVTYPAGNLKFLREVNEIEPDIVLSSSTFRPDSLTNSYIQIIKRTKGAWIVGGAKDGQALTKVSLTFRRTGGKAILKRSKTKVTSIIPKTQRLEHKEKQQIQSLMDDFCASANRWLGKAVFGKSFSRDMFMKYVLGILRVKYRTEVSFLNDTALSDDMFPLKGKVTAEKILRAIVTDSPLVQVSIKGKDVKSLLGSHITGSNGLKVLGLTKKGDNFYVNSRILDDEQHIKIVTTQFLAGGGGGFIPELTRSLTEHKEGIRTAVLAWFSEGKSSKLTGNPQVTMTDFPDLWKSYLFTTGLNLGVNFGNTSISGGSNYPEKSQLSRQDLQQINIDSSFSMGISSASNALSLSSRILYGKNRTDVLDSTTGGMSSVETETSDEIKVNLLYQWKRPKNMWMNGKWYSPVPFFDAGFQTEFTPSINDETRRFRILTNIAGVGWEILENRLFFKIGAGYREEFSAFSNRSSMTLYTGWQLANGDILKFRRFTLKGESRLDAYFFRSNEDGIYSGEVSSTNKLYVAITDRFFLNITNEIYAIKRSGTAWGVGIDVTFGLNILFDVRTPFFRF